jgi:hypothetical protein
MKEKINEKTKMSDSARNPGWDLLFSLKFKVAFLNPFLLTKQKYWPLHRDIRVYDINILTTTVFFYFWGGGGET